MYDDERAAIELEKLRAETRKLDVEARRAAPRSWVLRVLVPTIVGSVAAGASSYWFADSLQDRTRAEIRRDVLKTYFGTSNDIAGKRKQILKFVEVVSGDDEELRRWVEEEKPHIKKALEEAEAREDAAKKVRKALDMRLQAHQDASARFIKTLARTSTANGWLECISVATETVPGPVGRVLNEQQNAMALVLLTAGEVSDVPGVVYPAEGCSKLAEKLASHRIEAVGGSDDGQKTMADCKNRPPLKRETLALAERCRGELLSWAVGHSAEPKKLAEASARAVAKEIEYGTNRATVAPPNLRYPFDERNPLEEK